MTPAARTAAAIEILDAVIGGQAAEKALLGWSRRSRFAGSKDRAALRDMVFQALRCRRSFAAMGGSDTGRGLIRGLLAQEGVDEAAIFGADRYAPPVAADPDLRPWDDLSPADQWDLQDWVIDQLKADHGALAADIAQALRSRAPIWLRRNPARATEAQLTSALQDAGHTTAQHADVATAVHLTHPARGLTNLPAFQQGWFEMQDLASQWAVQLLAPFDGARVLDFCAGGGGKSLALAALGAQVTAHDANPTRMKEIAPRATRAGAKISEQTTAELDTSYDLVICDVPCSGSGAWRRAVDSKWTLTPAELDQMVDLQRQIVTQALNHLRPGGRFAYMTCSLFARENAEQAQWIAQTHGLDLTTHRQFTPLDGGDGFFVAVFQA